MMRSPARVAMIAGLVVATWAAWDLAEQTEGRHPAVAAAATLLIEHDVSVSGTQSDRFTWTDASGQPRVAALSQNRGGALVLLQYEVGGVPRVVGVTTQGAAGGGFGYVVSHPTDAALCTGNGDSSTLGFGVPGSFQRVFEGRHHAIFRFTQNYPRYCTKNPPAQDHTIPVTIDWVIATGRDHPLWAVTWDLAAGGVPADILEDDSRGPYGELLFDGSPDSPSHATIAGVAWGERYKFTSTPNAGPVTYNSTWTWDVLNSVPYVKLWTVAPDATMGTVQTQTMSQQDAGGYFGSFSWRKTDADGNACTVAIGGVDTKMPCNFNWPYQSINYSLDPVGAPNSPTNSTRLAWGTNFGFLGQTQYPVMGSADPAIGGPVGNGNPVDNPYASEDQHASGYPRKSYSTFIVLGLHSALPVEAQVTQIETVQATALTATVGSVRTSGPAGVNRTDTVTYAPAGWNHVYAAWAVQAGAGNTVDVNFNVGGTLTNPLIIVSGWTTGSLPDVVRLDGVALAQDVDYFPSVRASAQELWLTLNRNLAGAVNRLEMRGPIFADVPASYWARAYIEALYRAGVTGGCSTNPLNYCPDNVVTREQMAVFLLKAHDGSGVVPPPCTAPGPFADVPCSSIFAPWIQELVNRGITAGCGGGAYCPSSPVTREQMAVFLLKAHDGSGVVPPPCTAPGPFADVPCSTIFAPWIQELVNRGITAGCAPTMYCPTSPVTRAQMAVFLVKTFDLPFTAPGEPTRRDDP